jgi:hypothetical protein
VKKLLIAAAVSFILFRPAATAQEFDKSVSLLVFTGTLNYQGDLKPNSFTLSHASPAFGAGLKKPLSKWLALTAGVMSGRIEAADKWNRDYLKPRNLSFTTSLQEAFTALEINMPGVVSGKIVPYMYAGVAVFHFNPYTYDKNNVKTYLKPLSTEGQGLSQYPDRKPYRLTQFALPFGGGLRYVISDALRIGIEMSQRKTFTDYLDDVSADYVDANILLAAKGAKAVELSYREDEVPNGRPFFPAAGEQRGTPSEMDWYYYTGLRMEIKLNSIGGIFRKPVASQRCPRNLNRY